MFVVLKAIQSSAIGAQKKYIDANHKTILKYTPAHSTNSMQYYKCKRQKPNFKMLIKC